ncbi:MAG: manganese efflux pump [Clostridia bacterium]|nr:manganese efflux pump [Clostridia bacterium]
MFSFVLNSVLLGIGLAMDAFSVSLANGLNEPEMSAGRMSVIAGTFAFFQFLMPVLGWICVRFFVETFTFLQAYVPVVASALLFLIGGKMVLDAIRGGEAEDSEQGVSAGGLLVQGIATSIDALSVGFTLAAYRPVMAVSSACIIAVVTFVICLFGLHLGRHFGTRLSGKATALGGSILLFIGVKILLEYAIR